MDNETFDTIARSLAGGTSRRRLVRILGGGVLTASLGLAGPVVATPSADARKHRHHHHHHHHQCIPNTPPFGRPVRTCSADKQCCGTGSCCDFGGPEGLACYDLLDNQSACGKTCENAVNCSNFNPERQCLDGECVEV